MALPLGFNIGREYVSSIKCSVCIRFGFMVVETITLHTLLAQLTSAALLSRMMKVQKCLS